MEYPNCPNCGLPFFPEWTGDESKPYCQGSQTGACHPRVQFRSKAGEDATINTKSERFVPKKKTVEQPIETPLVEAYMAYLISGADFIQEEGQ